MIALVINDILIIRNAEDAQPLYDNDNALQENHDFSRKKIIQLLHIGQEVDLP